MFENETTRIISCYNESLKLINKLQKVMAPYDYNGPLKDAVFYNCKIRIYSASNLEYDAHNALNNVLKRHNISVLPERLKKMNKDGLTIKEHAGIINKITKEDFYFNTFYYETYHKAQGYNEYLYKEFDTNKKIFSDTRAHGHGMFQILNCINLLDNPEPITREQRANISNVLKTCNTFIFKGCKVTLYNNGRLVVAFSSNESFTAFKNLADNAIKQITKELENVKYC